MAVNKKNITSSANKKTVEASGNGVITTEISEATEASTNEIVSSETVETVEASPIVSYKAKSKIPMDAMVMVKNATGGKLVYVSNRLQGYEEIWYTFGEELPMEMAELYAMKNTHRRFFTENWIEVDPIVLRDLGMEQYYKDTVRIEDINDIFNYPEDELIVKIKSMKPSMINTFVLEAIKKVENGELTNLKTITAIEKTLDCELYEH